MTGRLASSGAFTFAVMLASGLTAAPTGEDRLSAAKLIQALTEPIDPYEHPEFLETTHTRLPARRRATANLLWRSDRHPFLTSIQPST